MKSERKRIEFSLLFQPSGRQIKVTRDETILQGGEKARVTFETECGGKGKCGKCKVKIIEPAPDIKHIGHTSDINETEKELLTDDEIKSGIRLACQTKLTGDVVVQNLCETKTSTAKIDIKGFERKVKLDSGIRTILVKCKTPQLGEKASYLDKLTGKRFKREKRNISLQSLQSISKNLGRAINEMTVVTFRDEIIDIEAGNTKSKNYGLAVDIGTTTLACYLINLNNGEQVTALAKTNSQAIYGSDVLSRIRYSNKAGGLRELHRRVKADINDMIKVACDKGMIKQDNIYKMVLVGNPCMEHLFEGISPVSLGRKPYAPIMRGIVQTKAKHLGIMMNKEGITLFLPLVSGFIGADAVAMILACRMDEDDKNKLAVDIGTNTEIVLSTKRKLMACSAAAGPAFEGAHIKYGVRATDGAIDKVRIDNEVKINVIGNVPAKGICGSGLIDAVAELLRIGVIDQKGRILGREELPPHISLNLRERVSSTNEGTQFEIARPDERYDKKPIYLTQKDIRELQLAQGAIAAGIRFLLKESGISMREVSEIFLAGAFGNFISVKNTIRIGLIPHVSLSKVRFVGNTAGEGARLALLSERLMKKAESISEKVQYLELSDRQDFLDLFVESMVFPVIKT